VKSNWAQSFRIVLSTTMEEVNFPRGGRSSLEKKEDESTNRKRKKGLSSSDKKRPATDFLFGSPPTDETNKIKRSNSKKARPADSNSETTTTTTNGTSKRSLLPLGGGAVVHPAKGQAYIESLSFSKLAKGFKLLAYVREVHDDLVVFSLPHQLTGYMLRNEKMIPPTSSSDHPSRRLEVGQLLSVQIVKAVQESTKDGPRRRIQVTCDPAVINPRDESIAAAGLIVRGQVMSIEDHGLGTQPTRFFAV
jgi:hypothetical protein